MDPQRRPADNRACLGLSVVLISRKSYWQARCNNMYAPKVKQEVESERSFPFQALFPAQSLCSATSHTIVLVHRFPLYALLSCISLPALSADPAGIDRCRTIADSVERLACFDRAAAAPAAAVPPRVEDFGKPPVPRAPEVAQVSAGLREFARTSQGRAVFVLDNGQTWRQLDSDTSRVHEPAPGESVKVTVERGIFDTFNLSMSGRNGMVKVRRLQ
jgi:hypothetical protein